MFAFRASRWSAILALVLLAIPVPSVGQSVWTHQDGRATVELELIRPFFADEVGGFNAATSAGFLTFRAPVADQFGVVADLPFSRADFDVTTGGSEHSGMVGNPYLGMEWRPADSFLGELGVRIPVGDADDLGNLGAILVGLSGELDRIEAFVPQTVGVYAMGNYMLKPDPAFTIRFRGGPAFVDPEGSSESLLLTYTGQAWYHFGHLNVGTGLTGRWDVTDDDGWGEATAHQVVVGADYGVRSLRPGLQLRIPLDGEVRDVAGYTLGVSLGVRLR